MFSTFELTSLIKAAIPIGDCLELIRKIVKRSDTWLFVEPSDKSTGEEREIVIRLIYSSFLSKCDVLVTLRSGTEGKAMTMSLHAKSQSMIISNNRVQLKFEKLVRMIKKDVEKVHRQLIIDNPQEHVADARLTKTDSNKSISVFVSYRRTDSLDVSGRIYDRLVQEFGSASIFNDIDAIPIGVDFRQEIDQMVRKCDIMLAINGPTWLTTEDSNKKRRLDMPDDFVRIEIEIALDRGIPVVPVLVQDTPIPTEADLPEKIRQLAFRQARPVRSDPDFHVDMDRLVSGIKRLFNSD